MNQKRQKKFRIKTVDQMKVVTSPALFEIVQVLQRGGKATVNELGPKLGRKPNSLHYHMRKLLKIGFVYKVETRRSGMRTEAVYDVVADHFHGPTLHENETLQHLTIAGVAALLRLATRNLTEAVKHPNKISESGKNRNLAVQRNTARLTDSQLAEVNSHLEALNEIFASNVSSKRGQMCALTMVLTPLKDVD